MNSFTHKSYLKQIIEIVEENFPKDWINPQKLEFKTEEEYSVWIVEKLFVFTEICRLFDFSIISGEYVSHNLKKDLNEINLKIKALVDFNISVFDSDGLNEKFQEKYYYQVEKYFVKPIVVITERYKLFCDSVNRSINFQNSNSILFETNDDDIIFEDDNEVTYGFSDRYKIINFNLELSKIDHFIKVDEFLLSRCFLISKEIEKIETTADYLKVLIQKANYLAYKILHRFDQDEKTYLYRLGHFVEEIKKEQLEVGFFNHFKELTENHYDEEKSKTSQFSKKRIDTFYNKKFENEIFYFTDFHAITKHYKDNKKSIERLENLDIEFTLFCDNLLQNPKNLFDKKAISVSKQYILNNLISLKIEQKEITYANFKDVIAEVEQNSDDSRTFNYFPYYKIAILLKNEIEFQFNSEVPDLKILNDLLSEYKKVITSLIKSIEWCEKNCFLAFQLPFNECIFLNEELDVNIFLSSSFVLPLSFPKIISELKNLESQILKFDTMFNIQKSITKQKDQIDAVRQEAQKYERRGIEILSVFAAIVLFVSGNIQVFTKVETFDRALQFMLVFAYAMGLFVFLIWFISRPDGVSNTSLRGIHWVLFGIFLIATIAAILVITGLPPFDKLNTKEEIININKRIDTTKMNIDTLVNKNHLKK